MRSLPLILVVLFCVNLSACQPAAEQNKPEQAAAAAQPAPAKCILRAGFDAWEPYHYLGQGEQPQGLDIEILQAVAAELNCELTLQQDTWAALLARLQSGEPDILPGASRSTERERYAWFAGPYRQEQFVLYGRTEAALNFPNVLALVAAGHKVGLVSGYYYGAEIDELLGQQPDAFVSAQLSELNMARLLDEEISALLEDSMVATAILRRKGLDRYISATAISLPASDVYLMLSKASVGEAQLQQLNAAVSRLQQQGVLTRLVQQYQQ
jgi:polar amino acid transport system substrate-binding protein